VDSDKITHEPISPRLFGAKSLSMREYTRAAAFRGGFGVAVGLVLAAAVVAHVTRVPPNESASGAAGGQDPLAQPKVVCLH